MSKRSYPRIRDVRSCSRGICVICGAKATHEIHVQVSWFRGDDDVMKACRDHRNAGCDALYAGKETGR